MLIEEIILVFLIFFCPIGVLSFLGLNSKWQLQFRVLVINKHCFINLYLMETLWFWESIHFGRFHFKIPKKSKFFLFSVEIGSWSGHFTELYCNFDSYNFSILLLYFIKFYFFLQIIFFLIKFLYPSYFGFFFWPMN